MTEIIRNCALILLFIMIGGVFAAAEMALVSLRESQVKRLAHRGSRGQTITKLTANPNRFLSAVQIGVTLAGFLSAAFGGATLSKPLGEQLTRLQIPASAANTVALVVVTAVISYVSIVVGELTAKRLALQRSETYALALAPIVDFIARIARPAIWLLGVSTNGLVRVLGGDPHAGREQVSGEEIRAMVSGSQDLGEEERQIVDDVFAAGTRTLREVMVPRTEVDFLDGDLPAYRAAREVSNAAHSRYPVQGESSDDILGFVHVRDLLDPQVSSRSVPVRDLVRPTVALPDTVRVLLALTELRRAAVHLAIVVDEYGGTAGIVTLEDLVEELVGEITDEYDEPIVDRGTEHNHEIEGLLTLEDFADRTGLLLPEGHYDTVAGFFVAELGRVPAVGDSIVVQTESRTTEAEQPTAVRLELRVTEVDGRRAARFWAQTTPLEPEQPPDTGDDPSGDPAGDLSDRPDADRRSAG